MMMPPIRIRHRLLDRTGAILAEFERDTQRPDRFEHWISDKSYFFRYAGTEDGVLIYREET